MVNKVILIGNVGADPEIHTFESGGKIARVRIATTERIFNPSTNEWSDHTEWHTVVAARQAGFVEMYVKKGAQVYVEGRLRRREWGEANDKRYATEIRADEFRLLGRRSDNTASTYQGSATPNAQSTSGNSSYSAPSQISEYDQKQPSTPAYSQGSAADDQTDDIPF